MSTPVKKAKATQSMLSHSIKSIFTDPFFSAINDLEKPDTNKSELLDKIIKTVTEDKVISNTKQCEELKPLVKFGLSSKVTEERNKAFLALKRILESVCKVKLDDADIAPDETISAGTFIRMAVAYMRENNGSDDTFVLTIGFVILENAVKVCDDLDKIKEISAVSIECEDDSIRSRRLSLFGVIIDKYHSDLQTYKKRSKESEIAALKRSTSSLSMSASSLSSSSSSSSSLDTQDSDAKGQGSGRPSINNYFSDEIECSPERGKIDVTNGKYGEYFLQKTAELNKELLKNPNDYTLYFYERYIIFVLKDNIDIDCSDIMGPVLEASLEKLEKRSFAIRFIAEYIVFSKEDKSKYLGKDKDKNPVEKCKKALMSAIKRTKDLNVLSDFFSFYSENFYKSNSKRIDDFIILAMDLMNADCTNEHLQEQSFAVLESIPATKANICKVGTESNVKFIVDTMQAYKDNDIICQKGAGILYKLLSMNEAKVNKSVHKKSTYNAIMMGIRNDHEPTKVICYRTLNITLGQDKLKSYVAGAIKKEREQIEHDVENPKIRRYVIPVILHSDLTKMMLPKIKTLILSNDPSQILNRGSCLSLFDFFSKSEPTPEIFIFTKRAMEMLDGDWEVQEAGCTVLANNVTEDNFSEGLEVIIKTVKRYYPGNKKVLSAGYNAILSICKKIESSFDAVLAAVNDPSDMEVMPVDDEDWRHPPRDLVAADPSFTIAEFYFKLLSSSKKTTKDPSEYLKLIVEVIKNDKCPTVTIINGITALENMVKLNSTKNKKLPKEIIETIVSIMEREKDYKIIENQRVQFECCKYAITHAKTYWSDVELIDMTIENLKKKRNPEVNDYYDKVSQNIKVYIKGGKKYKRSTVMIKEMENSYCGEMIEEDDDDHHHGSSSSNGQIPPSSGCIPDQDALKARTRNMEKENRQKRMDFEETFNGMTPDEMDKTLEEGLTEAEFIEIPSMLKYSKEIADDLKKKDLLKRSNGNELTISESMAISIYTYDNGSDKYEDNPFRVLNRSIAGCDNDRIKKLRVYMLYLLKALRKLEPYPSTGKLYRSISYPPGRVYNVGERFMWRAFTSTTKDKDIAMDFVNNLKDKLDVILFEIDGDVTGYNIRDFSFHPGEDEILLELDTLVEVTKIEKDPDNPRLTYISVTARKVNSLPIAQKVNEFTGKCVYNVVKQSPPSFPEIRGLLPVPVDEYDEQRAVDGITTLNKRYRDLKKCLARLMFGTERAMLLSLKSVIDDISYDDASIVKFNQLTQEESCAVYMSTYWTKETNGKRVCPTETVNDAFCATAKFTDIKVLYIMHVLNGLRKVSSFSNDGNPFYVCVPNGWEPIEGREYVIPGFSIVYTSKEEALKVARASSNEYTSVIEFSGENLKIYNVEQLSNVLKDFKMIMEPNFRFKVTSVGDKEVISVEPSDTQDENKLAKTLSSELEEFRKKIPLPRGWTVEVDDKTKKLYYMNEETCQTQWVRPDEEDPFYYENTQWKKSVLIQKPLRPKLTAGSRNQLTVPPSLKTKASFQMRMNSPLDEVPMDADIVIEAPASGGNISGSNGRNMIEIPTCGGPSDEVPIGASVSDEIPIIECASSGTPSGLSQSCNACPQSVPYGNPTPYTPSLSMPPQNTSPVQVRRPNLPSYNLNSSIPPQNTSPVQVRAQNPPPYTPSLSMPPQNTSPVQVRAQNPPPYTPSLSMPPQNTSSSQVITPNPPQYTLNSSTMPTTPQMMPNLGQSMPMQSSYNIPSRFPTQQAPCQTYSVPPQQWQQSQNNCPPTQQYPPSQQPQTLNQSFNGQMGCQIWRN